MDASVPDKKTHHDPSSPVPSPRPMLDMETTDPVCPPDLILSEQLVNISQKVLDTLQNSNIVEKGTSDDHSQFWTVYQKVAEEHDNEFLERYDGDMDIILIFSGLFSAVNTAFITTMGPRDSITTNALLTQIITLMVLESNGTSIGNAFPLPTPPAYPNGQVWFQALAYASLSFSLLAAFGAVLGKQWLRFYKLERFGRGSLEDRGKNRQKKFEGLKAWRFDAVLQMFPVLLQLSLLLFAISLSAYTWTQQQSITAIVTASAALGCLFYAVTLISSLLSPSCPFQTSASFILRMAGAFVRSGGTLVTNDTLSPTFAVRFRSFCRTVRVSISRLIQQFLNPKPPNDHTTESAVQWLLTTSTDPDNIAAAAALIPTITWQQDSNIVSYCQRLRDTFVGCFETDGRLRPLAEDRAVKCGRALNYLCLAGVRIEENSRPASQQPKMWHAWRSIILPREFNLCKTLVCKQPTLSGKDKQICQANARTALRMMAAAACDGFIHPDSDAIIWRGRFKWSGDCRTATDFDWLIDYLASDSCSKDDTVMGDAILALSAMGGLGSRNRASAYLKALISALNSDCLRVRYAALRAVSESRTAFVDINAIEDDEIRGLLLEQLSPALLKLILIDNEAHIKNYWRDDAYLRLIVTLTSNEEWCQRLVADQHIERCIFMLKHLDVGSPAPFHLAVISRRVFATCPDAAVFKEAKDTQFPSLAKLAWQSVLDLKLYDEDECTNALPDVINFTRQNTIATADLKIVRGNVRIVVDKLKRRNKHPGIILAMENYLTS